MLSWFLFMILADLHIHSKYSSQMLYFYDNEIMKLLKNIYPKNIFPEKIIVDIWKKSLLWKIFKISDSLSDPQDILRKAAEQGLKVISVTDHNTLLGSWEAKKYARKFGITVISGMEISTSDGEILGYGLKEKIPAMLSAEEAIKAIHKQGAVAVAAHPYNRRPVRREFRSLRKKKISTLSLDGLEVVNCLTGRISKRFLKLGREKKLALLSNSDSHDLVMIGTIKTGFPDGCKKETDFLEAIRKRLTIPLKGKPKIFKAGLKLFWYSTFARKKIRF